MFRKFKINYFLLSTAIAILLAGCLQEEFDTINFTSDLGGFFVIGQELAEGESYPADTVLSYYGIFIEGNTQFLIDTLNISSGDIGQVLSDEILLSVETGSNLRFLQGVEVYVMDASDLENEILIGFQDTISSTIGNSLELELEPNSVRDLLLVSDSVAIRTAFELRNEISEVTPTQLSIRFNVTGALQ